MQNSQENTSDRVSSLTLQAGAFEGFLLKKRPWRRCFPVNFVKFLRTLVLQNTSNGCLCISRVKSKFYYYEYGAATDYFTFSVLQCTNFLKHHSNCADTFHFDEVSLVLYLKGFNSTWKCFQRKCTWYVYRCKKLYSRSINDKNVVFGY